MVFNKPVAVAYVIISDRPCMHLAHTSRSHVHTLDWWIGCVAVCSNWICVRWSATEICTGWSPLVDARVSHSLRPLADGVAKRY